MPTNRFFYHLDSHTNGGDREGSGSSGGTGESNGLAGGVTGESNGVSGGGTGESNGLAGGGTGESNGLASGSSGATVGSSGGASGSSGGDGGSIGGAGGSSGGGAAGSGSRARNANVNPDPRSFGMNVIGSFVMPVLTGVIGGNIQLLEQADPNQKLMFDVSAGISVTTVGLAAVFVVLGLVRWTNYTERNRIMQSVIIALVCLTVINMCVFVVSLLQSKKH